MTKPRFDGKGTLFGDIHRDLPSGICMLDIDRMTAIITQELWLKKEEELFIEYRHIDETIKFVAIFEIKYKYVDEAFDPTVSCNRARMAMAKQLNARLFVVVQSNGKPPLQFYEIDTITGIAMLKYTLNYSNENRKEAVEKCWQELELYHK